MRLLACFLVLFLVVSSPADEAKPASDTSTVELEKKVAALTVYTRDLRDRAAQRESAQRSVIDDLRNRLVLAEEKVRRLENDVRRLQDLDRDVQRLGRDVQRVESDVRRLK